MAYAESLLKDDRRQWGYQDIAQFCETILVGQGREEDAYRRFSLPTAAGNTYLTMWRDLVKRYPDLDARGILEDLIETQGARGKWFAVHRNCGRMGGRSIGIYRNPCTPEELKGRQLKLL